ncbi:unnamed protein product [Phytomonas sp. EM1]|nr:unnamed protein product [Phytomonas sp. EM1]|eukprot:CCW65452.1 unnamed protein product [Phytomonas sp. isolate EM1]
MNALGGRCRSVFVVVEDEKPIFDVDFNHSRGSHCGCVLSHALHHAQVEILIHDFTHFCDAANIPYLVIEYEELTRRILGRAPDRLLDDLPPMVAVTCSTTAEYYDLCASLLRPFVDEEVPSQTSTYCLLAVVDLSQKVAVVPPARARSDELSWLKPPPSYASELAQTRLTGCDSAAWKESEGGKARENSEEACCIVPLHLYSNYPILRDCGTSGVDWMKGPNRCTLDAVLRELAYKAGQLPKYGS